MQLYVEIISSIPQITEQNFALYRGDTLTFNIAFKKDDGTAEDISDWKILYTAKKSKELADTDEGVITKDGVLDADPTKGLATVSLATADIGDCLGVYFYGIKYVDDETEPNIKTVLEGRTIFLKNTTQRIAPIT